MVDSPSPEVYLANLMSSSGCTSLTDAKFARYLDGSDSIGYMRCNFIVPTLESLHRQAEQSPPPTPLPEIVARHEKLKEQTNRTATLTQKPAKEAQPQDLGRPGPAETFAGVEGGEDGTHSLSSSSSGFADRYRTRTDRGHRSANRNADSASLLAIDHQNANLEGDLDEQDVEPKPEAHEMIVYLAGNSLGLPSRQSMQFVQDELNVWQDK